MKPIRVELNNIDNDLSDVLLHEYNIEYKLLYKVIKWLFKNLYGYDYIQIVNSVIDYTTNLMTIKVLLNSKFIKRTAMVTNEYTGEEIKNELDVFKDMFEIKSINIPSEIDDLCTVSIFLKKITPEDMETYKTYFKLRMS
jgi:hypothetical protein